MAAAPARELSDEEGSVAASSAALTTSLEQAFLIGKKDTAFLDEEAPPVAVTLAGRTSTVAADVNAIFGFISFLLFFRHERVVLDCFDGSKMFERLRKEEDELFEMFWVRRIDSLHLRSATCTSHICS